MATLTPRRLERDRLIRLDELVRATALPCLGWVETTIAPGHPLRCDTGLPASALAGKVPLLRVDASARSDVAELAAVLRGARPHGSSRLWWIASDAASASGLRGRAVLACCALGRPAVRFRIAVPLPLGLPLLRAVARAGVVLVDPSSPDTPPDPGRPTIALAPAVDPRMALRVLEEFVA